MPVEAQPSWGGGGVVVQTRRRKERLGAGGTRGGGGGAPTGEACRSTLTSAPCFSVQARLSGDIKERHETEKPLPVKSVVRCTDVRWAAVLLAQMYWRGCFVPFRRFPIDVVQVLDDAPETAPVAAFRQLGCPPPAA